MGAMEMIQQVGVVILTLLMMALLNRLSGRRLVSSLFSGRNRSSRIQAKRHFVQGAQLLARARAASAGSESSLSLAAQAVDEADRATTLDPRDAASHILKALALEFQGRRADAVRSLDSALSHPAVSSLAPREKGDALYKRVDLTLMDSSLFLSSSCLDRGTLDSAVSDLKQAVNLNPKNYRAFFLLGSCLEKKERIDEALASFKQALDIEPSYAEAEEAVNRLSGKKG